METQISKTNPLLERISMLANTFKAAAWLGWQIESNWTDAFVFAVYMVIKPLASAAILVVIMGLLYTILR